MIAKQLLRLSTILLGIGLVGAIACGAPASTPDPGPDTTPGDTMNGATPTPSADPTPVDQEPGTEMEGTLHVGLAELGPFEAHPRLTGNPASLIISGAGIAESLLSHDNTGALVPMLAEDWSVSEDFLTWTFTLRQGVQLHKGYGEMTAEDVVWSVEQMSESDLHPGGSLIRDIWQNPDGHLEIQDDYTIELNTGEAFSDIAVFHRMRSPYNSLWIASKQQAEEMSEEEMRGDTALTGPWEINDFRVSEYWSLTAVEDHWRQTPHFAEMTMWEIPEESSRVAGFQTGNLDTFSMIFDSIPLVEQVEGSDLVQVPRAGVASLNFYGQYYTGAGTDEELEAYDPELAWIAADSDINSQEWAQAAQVRRALATAVDRQAIVDTLLQGFGEAIPYHADYAGHESTHLDPDVDHWEFDRDRAAEMLEEAGYGDGFEITLSPSIRAAPAEVEACEAIAQMWGDIGVDVNFQRVPYTTLRPTLVGRTYNGATCHSTSLTLAPVTRVGNLLTTSVFTYGADHPFLEELGPQIETEVNPEERQRMEKEFLRFYHDHAITRLGLYTFDNVWPVGPRIQPWGEHVRLGDVRVLNGMEYIQPRQ